MNIPGTDDGSDPIEPPICPNCPDTCIIAGTMTHPFWVCPSCRTAIIAF